jgi:hypothetical protein
MFRASAQCAGIILEVLQGFPYRAATDALVLRDKYLNKKVFLKLFTKKSGDLGSRTPRLLNANEMSYHLDQIPIV